MQRTATIEEISTNETINGATISETIDITTIEMTPKPAERQHHHHHHHHKHHHHHHEHHQREESETTLVITDVNDVIETDLEQPQEKHHHHHKRHHQHRHKQQMAPQPPAVPPPLPTTAQPCLSPTQSLTQEEIVWQTDLDEDMDLPPQQSAPTIPEVESPAEIAATTAEIVAAATATATSQPPMELIIETPRTQSVAAAPSSPTNELVLVGTVSVETTDKRSKSYRVSTDLKAPPQEPKKCCSCIIA